MDKDFRYFVIVRRVIMIFCFDSKEVNLLSFNGFVGFFVAINFFISVRIVVEEVSSSFSVLT